MQNIDNLIEAILFFENQPTSKKRLASVLNVSEEMITEGINKLKEKLNGGIVLVEKNDEYMLGTSQEASEVIEKIQKEELSKELSKAALETLTLILYKGPIRRSEIDFIRGVNSQFIIRNLEARGLVEKISDPNDERVNLYRPTIHLYTFLGITKESDLPEYDVLRAKVESLEDSLKLNENDQ